MSQIQPCQTWGTDLVTTAGAGVFVPLPNHDCDEVQIVVPAATGLSLDVQSQSNPALASNQCVTIDYPSGLVLQVCGNAQEIGIRRNDGSATPVSVGFIWRRYRRG